MTARFQNWGKWRRALLHLWTWRTLLLLLGVVACLYSLVVLYYVHSFKDLGIKSAFDTHVKAFHRTPELEPGQETTPRRGDRVVCIADIPVDSWPRLLNAPDEIWERWSDPAARETLLQEGLVKESRYGGKWPEVKVTFQRDEGEAAATFSAWCSLEPLPSSELLPSLLWFFLKLLLLVVSVMVLWKRPRDPASVQFFVLCFVSLGAFIAGYHWMHIATQRDLVLGFIFWAVLVPPVTLHFYLVFPRQKAFLRRHRFWSLLALYGLPVVFLLLLSFLYLRSRWVFRVMDTSPEQPLKYLLWAIYSYFPLAVSYYLVSIAAQLHSLFTARDATERNQVKCILVGASLALLPMGVTLYMAVFDTDAFGAAQGTWWMFAASVCHSTAFIVSITKYRLMEVDQIISSSATYFFTSFLIGGAYYAVVFLGTLLFQQVLAGPPLAEALRVSLTALVFMLVMDLARSRFKRALDRRFHREKYHLDRTLQRMSHAVQQLVDPPALLQRLLHASADLLGAGRGAVYLRDGDPAAFRLAGQTGPAAGPPVLPPAGELLDALRARGVVVADSRRESGLSPAQRELRRLGGDIAHALSKDGQLLAFLVLGPKANGPYRVEDQTLLAAFAQITVIALESAEGHRAIENLNDELQAKIEKIGEQQRRILALQTQLRRNQKSEVRGQRSEDGGQQPEDRGPRSEDGGQESATQATGAAAAAAVGPAEEVPEPLPPSFVRIVGGSGQVQSLLQMVRKVARTDSVVLIRGESGTGKELLAHAVHESSPRAARPLVTVHCAALSPTLLESELFGHVKGAFTGAHKDKVGRFELADGGTLFLDEVGDIPIEVQTKLLRVLQEQTFERVGSSETIQVDVRIIAATHQNLEELIGRGLFREDLYYRLNVFPVQVPPLRERKEDIPELVMHFLHYASQKSHKEVQHIDDDALTLLKVYEWPGNIRQLENVLERAVVLAEGRTITPADLPREVLEFAAGLFPEAADGLTPRPAVLGASSRPYSLVIAERDRHERERLLRALADAGGNKAQAARDLGLARSTLVSRLKKLGIE